MTKNIKYILSAFLVGLSLVTLASCGKSKDKGFERIQLMNDGVQETLIQKEETVELTSMSNNAPMKMQGMLNATTQVPTDDEYHQGITTKTSDKVTNGFWIESELEVAFNVMKWAISKANAYDKQYFVDHADVALYDGAEPINIHDIVFMIRDLGNGYYTFTFSFGFRGIVSMAASNAYHYKNDNTYEADIYYYSSSMPDGLSNWMMAFYYEKKNGKDVKLDERFAEGIGEIGMNNYTAIKNKTNAEKHKTSIEGQNILRVCRTSSEWDEKIGKYNVFDYTGKYHPGYSTDIFDEIRRNDEIDIDDDALPAMFQECYKYVIENVIRIFEYDLITLTSDGVVNVVDPNKIPGHTTFKAKDPIALNQDIFNLTLKDLDKYFADDIEIELDFNEYFNTMGYKFNPKMTLIVDEECRGNVKDSYDIAMSWVNYGGKYNLTIADFYDIHSEFIDRRPELNSGIDYMTHYIKGKSDLYSNGEYITLYSEPASHFVSIEYSAILNAKGNYVESHDFFKIKIEIEVN